MPCDDRAELTAEQGSGDDVPHPREVVTSDGLTVFYEVRGTGAPLFLIPMGPGYAPDYLFAVRDKLSRSLQTVLIHLRGTGRTVVEELSRKTMSMDLVLGDIEAIRQDLGLDEVSVMGNSFGGIISMSYAARHPARVAKLVLAGSGGPSMRFTSEFRSNIRSRLTPWEIDVLDYWSRAEKLQRMPARANHEMIRATLPAYFYDRLTVFEMMETLTDGSYNHRVSDLLWSELAQAGYDITEALAVVDAPTLIIMGRQDIVGETTGYEINHAISNSELVFLSECGHFPWIEQEHDFFSRVVSFLVDS